MPSHSLKQGTPSPPGLLAATPTGTLALFYPGQEALSGGLYTLGSMGFLLVDVQGRRQARAQRRMGHSSSRMRARASSYAPALPP
jgi:hypothetical protein